MAKILFISDNLINESLGIMYLSSYLKANNHEVLLTLLSEHKNVEELINLIIKENPSLIGFSVMTPQVSTFRPISKIIKNRLNQKIAWGGAHCTFMPENVTKDDCADIICVGEGEEALLSLMRRIDSGEDYVDIPGLWVKRENRWIKNDTGNLEANLDKYPFPDRGLYYDKYKLLRNFAIKRLLTQRGCPYDCSYCFEHMFKELYKDKGKLVRRHSVEYALLEIKEIIRKYPVKVLHFSDDSFNLNKNWVMEFLSHYKENFKLPFTCNISVINLDESLIKKLKEAGCRGVVFGLESGQEDIRMKVLNKNIADSAYIKTAGLLKKYKLRFSINMMTCLPGETLDGAIEGINFCKSLKPFGVRVSVLKAYKNTKLANFMLNHELYENEGEFTYKTKNTGEDYQAIKNMFWAGYLLVKIPFLMHHAKKILKVKVARFFNLLAILNYWQEIRFFRVPLLQAWMYFWYSRKIFWGGLGKEQTEDNGCS